MSMSLTSWLGNRLKKNAYNQWVKAREGVEWAFAHPWEREFVEEKLERGWQQWSDDELRELLRLMVDVGARIIMR